jgi:hypothetical protein
MKLRTIVIYVLLLQLPLTSTARLGSNRFVAFV